MRSKLFIMLGSRKGRKPLANKPRKALREPETDNRYYDIGGSGSPSNADATPTAAEIFADASKPMCVRDIYNAHILVGPGGSFHVNRDIIWHTLEGTALPL